jgi:hypothetical protein
MRGANQSTNSRAASISPSRSSADTIIAPSRIQVRA